MDVLYVCMREEVYQIIDCGCADVVDNVDEELEREDDEEERWHIEGCDERGMRCRQSYYIARKLLEFQNCFSTCLTLDAMTTFYPAVLLHDRTSYNCTISPLGNTRDMQQPAATAHPLSDRGGLMHHTP